MWNIDLRLDLNHELRRSCSINLLIPHLCLALCVASGCDDDLNTPSSPSPIGVDLSAPPVEAFDARVSPDNGAQVSAELSAFGEPCSSHQECLSGYCIQSDDEGICTETCLGTSCPQGWGCIASRGTGPDIEYLCSPTRARLCKPCARDSDCPEGLCVSVDGQSVCARDCERDSDCPGAYICSAVNSVGDKQCTPQSGSCSCDATTDGAQRVCERANMIGVCYGRQTCDAETGWSACDAREASHELCNLIDDDCNGFTDDVALLGERCVDEGEIINSQGEAELHACSGIIVCPAEGEEPICTARSPIAELCNLIDDDCDGVTDESFPTLGEACVAGVGLCARYGVIECSEDATSSRCSATASLPEAERCDGFDNDCDGEIDEGFSGVDEVCEVGRGQCRRVGVTRCSESGDEVVCSAEPALPDPERCDGVDNDCDGAFDEGFEGLNELCSVGVGSCRQVDFMVCSEDERSVECRVTLESAAELAQPERCDGADNDCDAKVDEDFLLVNTVCQAGLGACERRGIYRCDEEGLDVECSVTAGEALPERCDEIDNDCDGSTDESWPELGSACTVGLGLCRRSGVIECSVNQTDARCSAPEISGAPQDSCDYQDDDCDGLVDEESRDLAGEYSSIEHCGACHQRCASRWGGLSLDELRLTLGVIPVCNRDSIEGSFECGYECVVGSLDADGRAENGCELRRDPEAIYVKPAEYGGDPSVSCGELEQPCATIALGLTRASQLTRPRVLVSEGIYRERVELTDGIQLLGGHDRVSWVRQPEVFVSQIDARGLPLSQADSYGVNASGIRSATTLSGFTIYGGDAADGGNAYGVYALDSDESLTIRDNRIISGDGGRGVDGASGESGADGAPGGSGRASAAIPTPHQCEGDPRFGATGLVGGAPTTQQCEGVDVSGGAGGYSRCPLFNTLNTGGAAGGNTRGGLGGLGAAHFRSGSPGICVASSLPELSGRSDARSGESGRPGSDGRGGARLGDALGRLSLGHWRAYGGQSGEAGTPGGGGGGGGAAAGVVIEWSSAQDDFGASGGSGGNGGCPGGAGDGGSGGGGSFGIFFNYLSARPFDASELPVLIDNIITRGYGGAGGRGGNGGGGGSGGHGGDGGDAGQITLEACSLSAGDGGSGGRGGHGGAGAGGDGGVSYDVMIGGTTFTPPIIYRELNQFTQSELLSTGGLSGRGGNASDAEYGVGATGRAGLSGHLGHVQR